MPNRGRTKRKSDKKNISLRVPFHLIQVKVFQKKIVKKFIKIKKHHSHFIYGKTRPKNRLKFFELSTDSTLPVLEHSTKNSEKNFTIIQKKYIKN